MQASGNTASSASRQPAEIGRIRERIGEQVETLFRTSRLLRVNGLIPRHQGVPAPQVVFRRRDPRISGQGGGPEGRRWLDGLPKEQHAVGRIGGQQPMEQRGARARQTKNEDRLDDRLVKDRGAIPQRTPDAESVAQARHKSLANQTPARVIQAAFPPEGIEQDAQALPEAHIAPVGQACQAARLVHQVRLRREGRRDADTFAQAHQRVPDTYTRRTVKERRVVQQLMRGHDRLRGGDLHPMDQVCPPG